MAKWKSDFAVQCAVGALTAKLVIRLISLLLQRLQVLNAVERIQYKLTVLTYKCLHGTVPS